MDIEVDAPALEEMQVDEDVSGGGGISLKSAALQNTSTSGIRRKGRGFQQQRTDQLPRDGIRSEQEFERHEEASQPTTASGRAQRSVEGWIVLVSNVHEECTEEEITERFSEYGPIRNLHLNLDRRTGFVKGYCLIEYEHYKEAAAAIEQENGKEFFDQRLECDFAFVRNEDEPSRVGLLGSTTSMGSGGRRGQFNLTGAGRERRRDELPPPAHRRRNARSTSPPSTRRH